MSGGSPIGGRSMRLRYSQGYGSSGDDLEDDACSRPFMVVPSQSPLYQRKRSCLQVFENLLWIASSVFIIYYGDQRSNFIYLLLYDTRIRRMPLYIGLLGVVLNFGFFLYSSMLLWGARKSSQKWELSCIAALPCITIVALCSFCLFSFALWPIWSFLTLPLVVHFSMFYFINIVRPWPLNYCVAPVSLWSLNFNSSISPPRHSTKYAHSCTVNHSYTLNYCHIALKAMFLPITKNCWFDGGIAFTVM